MKLHNPWFLALLLIIIPYIWLRIKGTGRGLPIADDGRYHFLEESWRVKLRFLPEFFLWAAFFLLIIALARPQKGTVLLHQATQGVAIEMVIDRSNSMSAVVDNSGKNRLDIVKEVFQQFLLGNGKELQGRPNDLIGLISFARYADTNAPLTLSHQVLAQFLNNIQLVDRKSEDGTSIGDAIALAAARLAKIDEQQNEDYRIKSKMIILLTDGVSNAGRRTPLEAAQLAEQWGIRIYTIGFRDNSPLMALLGSGGYGADEETLKEISRMTKGAFFEATNIKELEEVYKEINNLETSEIESYQTMEYKEFYIPFLIASLITFLLFLISRFGIFRGMEL